MLKVPVDGNKYFIVFCPVFEVGEVLKPPRVDFMGKVINQFCPQANFNPLDDIKNQKPQFPVEIVQVNDIFEFAVWFKNMVDFIGLHGPPIALQAIVADVAQKVFGDWHIID